MQTLTQLRPPRQLSPGGARRVVDRHFWILAAALLAVFVVLAWIGRRQGVDAGQDDAMYLFLARSLRSFGYHDLYLVNTPLHHMYPPGYPAVLAVLGLFVGERIAVLQGAGIVAAAAALALFAATVRQLWSSTVALLCLAVLMVNPHLLVTAGKITSDATYLLFSMLALWLLAQRTPSTRLLVVAAAAAIAAAFTRSVGVTLLAALGAHWLLERRYVASFSFAAVCAATVGAWLLWTIFAPEQYVGRSYIADASYNYGYDHAPFLGVLLGRVLVNGSEYFAHLIPNRVGVPPLPGPEVLDLLVAAAVGLALLGGLWVVWKRWRLAALYLPAFGALLVAWTWSVGRFLNVVIPLLVLAILLGVRTLAERVRPGWGSPALAAMALALVLFGSVRALNAIERRSSCVWGAELPPPECRAGARGAFFNALEYVNHHLSPDAVIVSGKPAAVYYFTGRKTILLAQVTSQDPAALVEFFKQQNAGFVVLTRLDVREYLSLAPLLEENCSALALEASFQPHTHVLRVLEPGEPPQNGAACQAIGAYREAPFRQSNN